ncbi:MAG: hypothetical protein RLZZ618_1303 [Pseudomonadota bacterium]|jgi:hypothetical protein
MKNYLAIFAGTADSAEQSGWNKLSGTERAERTQLGIKEWGVWMQTHHAHVVVPGGPVGKTTRVAADGFTQVTNNIAGYLVVSAESQQAAASLFEGHPHFSIFPGEAVEIMECLPVPGM